MFLTGGGGNSFECALSKGGSFKCVQNACRGREGVKKGQKTACALYVWPLTCLWEELQKCMGVLAGPSDWMLCNEGGQKTPHQSRGNSGHSAVWPQTTFNNRKFFIAVCLDVVESRW